MYSSVEGLCNVFEHRNPDQPFAVELDFDNKIKESDTVKHQPAVWPFSSPEPTILLACSRNRELWEQPFQACAIDADYVRPDGQNSVISFVISKWLLPDLSIPAAGQKDRRLWGRESWQT